MEDLLIEILALDLLVKTYRETITSQELEFQDEDEEMVTLETHDRALELLKHKLEQLPSRVREEIQKSLWLKET